MTTTNNPAESRERDDQTVSLTESELSEVTGGSQSSGAGAGKIRFNPFSITRKSDAASPKLFL
jgi:type VI protein secretion system component Hcp